MTVSDRHFRFSSMSVYILLLVQIFDNFIIYMPVKYKTQHQRKDLCYDK